MSSGFAHIALSHTENQWERYDSAAFTGEPGRVLVLQAQIEDKRDGAVRYVTQSVVVEPPDALRLARWILETFGEAAQKEAV